MNGNESRWRYAAIMHILSKLSGMNMGEAVTIHVLPEVMAEECEGGVNSGGASVSSCAHWREDQDRSVFVDGHEITFLFASKEEIALEISIFDGGLWKLVLKAAFAKGNTRHKSK